MEVSDYENISHNISKRYKYKNGIRKVELGKFLKTKRAELQPEFFGIPRGRNRKTPGLRREEVANLLNISVTWYTWLEQGRQIKVSKQVLNDISNIFQLDESESIYLSLLAGHGPTKREPKSNIKITSTHKKILNSFDPFPAYIYDYKWDVLAWNSNENQITKWDSLDECKRNVLWNVFANDNFRNKLINWDTFARTIIASFRMETTNDVNRKWFKKLISELTSQNSEFNELWNCYEVQQQLPMDLKFDFPSIGRLSFNHINLSLSKNPKLSIRVLVPLDEYNTLTKLQNLKKKSF